LGLLRPYPAGAHAGDLVLEARSGPEALQISEQFRGPIHLLLTDVVMPELSGCELIDRLKVGRPHMVCLLMSGYPGDSINRDGVRRSGAGFLEKPFALSALLGAVREALGQA
jgi:YesN/AraC family two-component response regulator